MADYPPGTALVALKPNVKVDEEHSMATFRDLIAAYRQLRRSMEDQNGANKF